MQLKIGLVGHGHWGSIVEKTLNTFSGVEVCVINKGAYRQDIDGVMITTPSATHAQVAIPYIRAGIPTFIEKPLVTSSEDALTIQKAAEEHGVYVQVGHIHTHNSAFLAMRDYIPQLGAVRLASFEHLYNIPRTDSSVFWDCLPHTLSIAQILFNEEPSEMRGWSLSKTHTGLTEGGTALFRCGATTMFSYMNWLSPVKRTSLTLFGEHATLMCNDGAQERKLTLIQDNIVSYPAYDSTPPLTREVQYFLNAIHAGTRKDASLEMGVRIVSAIEHFERSLQD